MVRARFGRLLLVAVSAAALLGACKEFGTTKRAGIGLQVGSRAVPASDPHVTIPFVETGDTDTITVTVKSEGETTLEVGVPELRPMDWIWAAGDEDVRENLWPEAALDLGGRSYDQDALLGLLESGKGESDASVALAQALIRTKLVIASGGPDANIQTTVDEADAWLAANDDGDGLPYDIAASGGGGADAVDLAGTLNVYNDRDNPHLTFDPEGRYEAGDFPLLLEPEQTREFNWLYAPTAETGEQRDGRPMMLVIPSNDERGNEEFRVFIEFTEQRVRIRVQPSTIILVNPTSSRPVSETVAIHNDGTGTLIIEDIRLQRADDEEYDLIYPEKPQAQWLVLPATDAAYEPLTFQVRYGPRGDPMTNAVIVTSNDTANRDLTIPIEIQTSERANCVFSYEDQAKGFLDFADAIPGDEKVVSVYNEGPSNCVVQAMHVEPDAAAAIYTVRLQRPATGPGLPPQVLDPPLSLGRDKSAEIVVTFEGNPDDPASGALSVEYENPAAGHFYVPIIGGAETPVLSLGPQPDSPQVHLFAAVGESDSGTFVIANNGNADLEIYSVAAHDQFASDTDDCDVLPEASDHFAVEGGPIEDLTVPSFSLYPLTLTFAPQNDEPTRQGYVQIAYRDPNAADGEHCQIARLTGIGHVDTATERPTAAFTWTPSAPSVGDLVLLDATSSAAPAGAELWSEGYVWYMTAKPAGSKLILNETSGPNLQFTPDVAGTYTLHLVVFTLDGTYGVETVQDVVVQ